MGSPTGVVVIEWILAAAIATSSIYREELRHFGH
jgi:hypothetical protein